MKKCWSIVKRHNKLKNLPPYTRTEEFVDEITGESYWQIVPETNDLFFDIGDGYVKELDRCDDDYRGYAVIISDHGNITLVFRYKNGNTKEIWSMV